MSEVWELAPHKRREGLVQRLSDVAGLLARPTFHKTPGAWALAERIEAYSAVSVVRALPGR